MIEIAKKCSSEDCNEPVKTRGYCNKHYVRWQRHGHIHDTRSHDWGSREKHPLYVSYYGIRRTSGVNGLCERWQNFWNFVEDVKEKPKEGNCHLKRKDDSKPWSLENVYWKERKHASEDVKAYAKQWRKDNPRKCHDKSLRRHYGIGVDEYEFMWNDQNGVCKICNKPETCIDSSSKKVRRLAVDHCHASGKIRHLLCTECNRGLGSFKDSPDLLTKAIEYLRSHEP